MNIQTYFFSLCILSNFSGTRAMDGAAMDAAREIGAFVPGARHDNHDGININQAFVGIRNALAHHNHVAGENQYHVDHHHVAGETQLNQEYSPAQSFMRQMLNALLSGFKQSCFETGNCGGRFIDYATKISASVLVGLSFELARNIWNKLFNKQNIEDQEVQKNLAQLATQEALLQSLAGHLKTVPRQTEAEKETYKTLHDQYISMLKQFTAQANQYMACNNTKAYRPTARA